MLLLDYDYHIHTCLNGHSDPDMNVARILRCADALGLKRIAITEHIMSQHDLAWYHDICAQAQAQSSQCEVLVGAEIDMDRHHPDQLIYNDTAAFDIVLASLHWFPGTDIMPHCSALPRMSRDEVIGRWREALLGLASHKKVDIMAHPGAMIGSALREEAFADDVLAVFEEAAELSAASQVAWEVNRLIGIKLTPAQRQTYYQVLEIALNKNVTLVYGSDAHTPEDIGSKVFVEGVMEHLGGWELLQKPSLAKVKRLQNS